MERNELNNQGNSGENLPSIPLALQRKIHRHYTGAFFVTLLTIVCIIAMKNWGYLIGFLFAAYLVWLGVDIGLRWKNGEIVCKRAVCIKVKKVPFSKNKMVVLLRDLDAQIGDETGVMNFYLPESGKDTAQFAERTIFNIYVGARNTTELLAWQAIDLAVDE